MNMNGLKLRIAETHEFTNRQEAGWPRKSRHPKLQSSAKRRRPGLVNFVSAVAYHSCLSLPAAFTQPGRSLLADPCIYFAIIFLHKVLPYLIGDTEDRDFRPWFT